MHIPRLAQELDVSLTPVRQAVQHLAAEGLIEVRPRSGTFVVFPTAREIEETFEIRCALECLAAEKAVSRFSAEELAGLKVLLENLSRPVRTGDDRTRHERDNYELHRRIVHASGNLRLAEMYESLHGHITIARIHWAGDAWLERLGDERHEHERIVNAFLRRDAEEAVCALRSHIRRAKDALIGNLTPVR